MVNKEAGQDYSPLVAELREMLEIEDEEFKLMSLNKADWTLVGKISYFKAKLIHGPSGVFIKAFSPSAKEYAQKCWEAFQDLGQLKLKYPILMPEAYLDGALVFKAGEVVGKDYYEKILEKEDREAIEEVLDKHGLQHLFNRDKLDLVEVDGKTYIVDPIEDSEDFIFRMIKPYYHSDN